MPIPTISIFVISWAGQHDNVVHITRELDAHRSQMSVVYSDPDPDFRIPVQCHTIRRPNDLFWGDKFKTCLEAFTGDVMLVIQGDSRCEDWPDLVSRCQQAFDARSAIGVWSPLIRGSFFEIETTRLGRINATSLSVVAQTDGICFAAARPIVGRMKIANYDGNIYGWGIEWMMMATTFCRNMLAVVDCSVTVHHPAQRGYPSEPARLQMDAFLQQLTLQERAQYLLLEMYTGFLRKQRKSNSHG